MGCVGHDPRVSGLVGHDPQTIAVGLRGMWPTTPVERGMWTTTPKKGHASRRVLAATGHTLSVTLIARRALSRPDGRGDLAEIGERDHPRPGLCAAGQLG